MEKVNTILILGTLKMSNGD